MFNKDIIITSLDLGNSIIRASVVKARSDKSFDVLGIANVESRGLKHGSIINAKEARGAISKAMYEAEKMSGKHINSVVINVSNPFIVSEIVKVKAFLDGRQVLGSDVKNIISSAKRKVDVNKYEILKCETLQFDVDNEHGLTDPEFMFANHMTGHFNVISVPLTYMLSISNCLLGCHVKVQNFCLSSIAASKYMLPQGASLNGVLVVDIGAANTDYVLFQNDKISELGTIPLGGMSITQDIARYFGLDFKIAEKIKISHGSLREGGRAEIQVQSKSAISTELLQDLIKARIREIMDLVVGKTKSRNHQVGNIKKIVLCGGVAKTEGLQEFINLKFNIDTTSEVCSTRFNHPEYLSVELATSLGALLVAEEPEHGARAKSKQGGFKQVFEWVKENF